MKIKKAFAYFVGCKAGKPWEIFKHDCEPTRESHGDKYNVTIGPFRTKRGANFMALYGSGNPHCQTVADAERLAKQAWKTISPFPPQKMPSVKNLT